MPGGQPQFLTGPKTPPSIDSSEPSAASACRVWQRTLATSAIAASASPRKPSVADPEQVVGLGELARGVRLKRQEQVVGRHPRAVVGDADQVLAAPLDRQVDPRVALASIAFSSSSLTTLAGRSTTSPAAI